MVKTEMDDNDRPSLFFLALIQGLLPTPFISLIRQWT